MKITWCFVSFQHFYGISNSIQDYFYRSVLPLLIQIFKENFILVMKILKFHFMQHIRIKISNTCYCALIQEPFFSLTKKRNNPACSIYFLINDKMCFYMTIDALNGPLNVHPPDLLLVQQGLVMNDLFKHGIRRYTVFNQLQKIPLYTDFIV